MATQDLSVEFLLPYINPGTDMKNSIVMENKKVNLHKTIDKHIALLEQTITTLKELKSNIPKDHSLKLHTNDASITFDGDNKLISKLLDKELVIVDEFMPENDDDDDDDEEEEDEDDEDNEEADEEEEDDHKTNGKYVRKN